MTYKRSPALPRIVFSMNEPVTHEKVFAQLKNAVTMEKQITPDCTVEELDSELLLAIDLYLGNLIRHRILARKGPEYSFVPIYKRG